MAETGCQEWRTGSQIGLCQAIADLDRRLALGVRVRLTPGSPLQGQALGSARDHRGQSVALTTPDRQRDAFPNGRGGGPPSGPCRALPVVQRPFRSSKAQRSRRILGRCRCARVGRRILRLAQLGRDHASGDDRLRLDGGAIPTAGRAPIRDHGNQRLAAWLCAKLPEHPLRLVGIEITRRGNSGGVSCDSARRAR